MATEGEFPKIDGDVLYASEVNKFEYGDGILFRNFSNLLWNAARIGFNTGLNLTGVPDWSNMSYDTLQTITNIKTTGDIKNIYPISANVLDDFENASIDTGIWATSGTVTESTGYITMSTTASGSGVTNHSYIRGTGASAINFKQTSSIFLTWYGNGNNSTAGSSTSAVYLRDEAGHEVNLYTHSCGNNSSYTFSNEKLRININSVGGTAYATTDFTSTTDTGISLATLTGNTWSICVRATAFTNSSGATGSASTSVNFIRYLLNSAVTKTVIIQGTTGTTITDAILSVNKRLNSGVSDAVYYLTADGTNWEVVTPNQIHRFTNTGANLQLKVSMTGTTSQVYELGEYAIWYNSNK